MDTERNAPSFVIKATNGTGSLRQFASKAARCKARAAFELCAPVVHKTRQGVGTESVRRVLDTSGRILPHVEDREEKAAR
jgi:hypothetical protein